MKLAENEIPRGIVLRVRPHQHLTALDVMPMFDGKPISNMKSLTINLTPEGFIGGEATFWNRDERPLVYRETVEIIRIEVTA